MLVTNNAFPVSDIEEWQRHIFKFGVLFCSVFNPDVSTKLQSLVSHSEHHLIHLGWLRRGSYEENEMQHKQFKALYDIKTSISIPPLHKYWLHGFINTTTPKSIIMNTAVIMESQILITTVQTKMISPTAQCYLIGIWIIHRPLQWSISYQDNIDPSAKYTKRYNCSTTKSVFGWKWDMFTYAPQSLTTTSWCTQRCLMATLSTASRIGTMLSYSWAVIPLEQELLNAYSVTEIEIQHTARSWSASSIK